MMSTLPTYLKDRAEAIRGLNAQTLPQFGKAYLGLKQPQMLRLYAEFPSNSIQRADLAKLYADWKDPVLAAIATFVWGYIDTTKSRRLQKVLAFDESELRNRLNRIRGLVQSGKLEEAFLSCCSSGENCIPGVGLSFFTKLFYFVGAVTPALNPKPLILDRWTTNAFFALRGQSKGTKDARDLFTIPSHKSLARYKAISLKNDPEVQSNAYVEYVTLMNDWAAQLEVAPDKLEQFVFGIDLRRDRSPTNPRNELLAIIETQIS
jgi:hypothetical protein